MVFHIPNEVINDPDIWSRATRYEIPFETAVRALGGYVTAGGVEIFADDEGLKIHETKPERGVVIDIIANDYGIGGTGKCRNEITAHSLDAEYIISTLISLGPLVGIEYVRTLAKAQ